MTKHEKLSMWRGRIDLAEQRRKCFFEGEGVQGTPGWVPGVDFAVDVYRGKSKPPWWPDQDPWVHIGKLKSAVRAAIPSLLYSNPKFRLFPATRDIENGVDVSDQRARAKELWLNHIWAESNATQHVRNGIGNGFFSIGSIKCGYLCHYQDSKERGVFARTDDGEFVLDEAGDPTLERGEYLTDESGALIRDQYGVPVPNPGTLAKEEWFVEVMDPKMLLFDCESGPDFFQHNWFIEEWVRPLSEVKNDPRYKASVRKRLTASENVRGPASQRKSIFDTPAASDSSGTVAVQIDEERIRGYDIYDFQNREYLVIPDSGVGGTTENNEFLLETSLPAGTEHGPTRHLKYTEDIGAEWYPIPDAIDMALVNVEYNITRSQMMIHREHTKTRYLELPGAFEGEGVDAEEERAKFAHGPDATLIKVTSTSAIFPAPKAQLDNSFMQAIPNIAADFNEVGGMPGESRGVADADTATQASILASGAEIRNNDRRDNQVQKWLCEIGRALLISGQANADPDSVVMQKIREATGVLPFRQVPMTEEELLGEFEVTVEIGSTLNKSDPRTGAQLMQLMTAFSQNPWIATVKGLTRRALDNVNLDPIIADELASKAEEEAARQSAPAGGAATPLGQVLGDTLAGGIGNQQAGAPTGAAIN